MTGLQDPLALSHIRAQAILTHEITTPILWMGKKSKILDCNVFLADVLASLKRWGDQASTHATELMALDGHLRKYTYPDDSAHDDECMAHVVASRDDVNEDAHVLALLKGCCEAGIILWQRHCSEHLEPDDSAKVPTEDEIKRASMCAANNDVCESNLSLAKYMQTTMQRLRGSMQEAMCMLKRNKPINALKAGQLGPIDTVFKVAQARAKTRKQQVYSM